MKNQKTDVLIVGAGPTGLMAACQLALRKINFKIIDKTADHTTQSRALIIHARTLEIFEQMGLIKEFLKRGRKTKAFNFLLKGNKVFRIDVSTISEPSTMFPYFLILEQAETEKILLQFLKKLGHSVERETQLLSFQQNKKEILVTIQLKTEKRKLQVQYLIGADGAKSKVRHLLKIPFEGKTYEKYFVVVDCKTDWQAPEDEMYGAFGKNDFGLFLHMKEKKKIRVIGTLPQELVEKKEINFSDIYPNLIEKLNLDFKLYDPKWISAYHTHHRIVENFQAGRCFLAGDAAHIHSPVGGQGMNTGLQDAYNLSWKLAMVLSAEAKGELLETYNSERLQFARFLVHTTDKIFSFVISDNPLIRFFRLNLFPKLATFFLRFEKNKKKFFQRMSQLGIAYHDSVLSAELPKNYVPALIQPGDRFPHLMINKVPIENYLKGPTFHLFVFGSKVELEKIISAFQAKWGDLIMVHSLQSQKFKKLLNVQKGFCLIRPDRHIAFIDNQINTKRLEDYLLQNFIIKKMSK